MVTSVAVNTWKPNGTIGSSMPAPSSTTSAGSPVAPRIWRLAIGGAPKRPTVSRPSAPFGKLTEARS